MVDGKGHVTVSMAAGIMDGSVSKFTISILQKRTSLSRSIFGRGDGETLMMQWVRPPKEGCVHSCIRANVQKAYSRAFVVLFFLR